MAEPNAQKRIKPAYTEARCFKDMDIEQVRKIIKEFTARKLEGETIFKRNKGHTPGFA